MLKDACIHGMFAVAAGLVHSTTICMQTHYKTKHTVSQFFILQKAYATFGSIILICFHFASAAI